MLMILYLYEIVQKMIEEFKNDMVNKYEMSDMGMLRYFLGIEIYQNKNNLFISQKNYVDKNLKKFNVATPVLVGEMLKKED